MDYSFCWSDCRAEALAYLLCFSAIMAIAKEKAEALLRPFALVALGISELEDRLEEDSARGCT
jgi:hypothetical protein